MNCNEQIPDPQYTSLSYDCAKEIGHLGAHESASGRKLPRPIPSGDAEEALDLIDQAAGPRCWDLHERDFYVKFSVTNVYMIKISAESEDDALKRFADYCDFPDFSQETPVDSSVEAERPDVYERLQVTGAPIGPQIACPDCGKLSMTRAWHHNPFRKCHGPIQWRDTGNQHLRWRYRRTFANPSAPALVAVGGGDRD